MNYEILSVCGKQNVIGLGKSEEHGQKMSLIVKNYETDVGHFVTGLGKSVTQLIEFD